MLLSKFNVAFNCSRSCLSTCTNLLSVKLDYRENVYPPVARTSLSSPVDHTKAHVGMWYTIDPAKRAQVFSLGLSKKYETMASIFEETALMIREPAVTAMDYIKRSNLTLPPNKFMIYGGRGIGKTLCLAHIVHFLHDDGWIVVHVNQPNMWVVAPKEILSSMTKEGHYDHTIDASAWLKHFKLQNEYLLQKLGLVTKEQFTWTQRESTEAGSSLSSFVDSGISRARYSSDCVYFLLNHLKQYANEGRCKVAFVAEGINCFFTPEVRHRRPDRSFIETENFTLLNAFRQLMENDWKNGCIVGSIDMRCSPMERRESELPRYLLRRKGWDALDPFVPIKVENYTDVEFNSVLSYYNDRQFLMSDRTHSEVGKKEIDASSGRNPTILLKLAKSR